ncbi:hypothetical protein ACFFQF_26200 [Haladaptatus pallidirubidus]|uniref:Uncharacterized protein n=1 Tax=Haladaptatus pallidirubidus TaxID=1008152 RepID=A0AAV3UN43_9EURY|nr:hypothetical protein [Haladaptatus pallidirubidus]
MKRSTSLSRTKGEQAYDLSGLTVSFGDTYERFPFPGGTSIEPGESITVGTGSETTIDADYNAEYDGYVLYNGEPDIVELRDENGIITASQSTGDDREEGETAPGNGESDDSDDADDSDGTDESDNSDDSDDTDESGDSDDSNDSDTGDGDNVEDGGDSDDTEEDTDESDDTTEDSEDDADGSESDDESNDGSTDDEQNTDEDGTDEANDC